MSATSTEELAIADGIALDRSDWKLVRFGDIALKQNETVDRENTDLTCYVNGGHMGSEDLHLREWGEVTDEYLRPPSLVNSAEATFYMDPAGLICARSPWRTLMASPRTRPS